MRLALLNDTSNNDHYGCFAVGNGLRTYFRRDDIEITPIFNRQVRYDPVLRGIDDTQRAAIEELLAGCDYLILNGEGTPHRHRGPEIEAFLEIVIRRKIPFCVTNSMFRDYALLAEPMRAADCVALSDDRSVAEVQAPGIAASRCADAARFARFEPWRDTPRGSRVAATDWHGEASVAVDAIVSAVADTAEYVPFLHPSARSDWPVRAPVSRGKRREMQASLRRESISVLERGGRFLEQRAGPISWCT